MATTWGIEEMLRWDFDKVEGLAGLVSYIATFLDSRKARQGRWKVMGQLTVQPGVPMILDS